MAIETASRFDTREHLANAAEQAERRGYSNFLIVDVDAHHYETESWAEITRYIEDPVIRRLSETGLVRGHYGGGELLTSQPGQQDVGGRIVRYLYRSREETGNDVPREVTLTRRAMDSMGIDYTILFPTPMLNLSLHPQVEMEVGLARAYARWMTERVLPADPGIGTMLYLPFNDPAASLKMVEEFSEKPGVVGFMVTTVRYRPVHDNAYMPVYAALEERGMPLGFHSAWNWYEQSLHQFNRFMSVHAVGRALYSMIHLTNFVVNGIPERFPGLRVIWIEAGLAWIPFMMQRLDMEYRMRSSEAPLLTKKPSEYMREFYYTQQPMEMDDLEHLELTFKMIRAETQLLYASDYPHWDFDLPSVIYDLPFLDENAKRRILGGNARDLFRLDEKRTLSGT